MVPMLMPQVCHAPSWPVVPLPTSAAGCATRSQWASLRGTSCLPTALQEPSLWSWAPVVTSSPRMYRSRDIESTAPSTTSMTRNFASSLQVCLSYCERESIIKYTAWLVIIGKFRVDKNAELYLMLNLTEKPFQGHFICWEEEKASSVTRKKLPTSRSQHSLHCIIAYVMQGLRCKTRATTLALWHLTTSTPRQHSLSQVYYHGRPHVGYSYNK